MANEAQRQELVTRVRALVDARFGGDYRRAFAAYEDGADGKIRRGDLARLFADAGIGNAMTRGLWVDGVLKRLDSDGDGAISWDEFSAVL